MLDQYQSPLFRLPGELRNQIYALSLVTEQPIVDPKSPIATSNPTSRTAIPSLGTGLLACCQRVYVEVDRTPLYTANIFRFTTAESTHAFLSGIPTPAAELVRRVELDVSASVYDNRARTGWNAYLSKSNEEEAPTTVPKEGCLSHDTTGVNSLTLNIGAEVVWTYLSKELDVPAGLQRLAITGASEQRLKPGWKSGFAWARDNYHPMNYLGNPNGVPHVVDRMLECVEGEDVGKGVAWVRRGGDVTIEVGWIDLLSVAERRTLPFVEEASRLPPAGCISFAEYEENRGRRIDYV